MPHVKGHTGRMTWGLQDAGAGDGEAEAQAEAPTAAVEASASGQPDGSSAIPKGSLFHAQNSRV